jgi:hypothetical protein
VKNVSRGWKISALVALAAAALPCGANAQNASLRSNDYYNLYEVGVYGGFAHYGKISDGLGSQISTGGLVGVRLTANPFEHFGFEGQYQIDSWNHLKFFTPVKGINLPEFPLHVYSGALNALAYFTDRNSTCGRSSPPALAREHIRSPAMRSDWPERRIPRWD